MNRGIYPILSGAVAQERQIQVLTNNIANVNTAGFKQNDALFRSLLSRSMGAPAAANDRVFVSAEGLTTVFEPGRFRQTGNPFDLAVEGQGFFEIKTPEGLRYTRNGSFRLDNKRQLVTETGDPVMGKRGPIKIAPGDVHIDPRGAILVAGQEVGAVKIVEFPEKGSLRKAGDGVFAGENPKPVKEPTVQVGYLEESNVNAISEMVKLIQSMRTFESAQKFIQTFDRMTEMAVQEIGRVG